MTLDYPIASNARIRRGVAGLPAARLKRSPSKPCSSCGPRLAELNRAVLRPETVR